MTLSNDHIIAWVTRPERPKGAKDEVKRPEGPAKHLVLYKMLTFFYQFRFGDKYQLSSLKISIIFHWFCERLNDCWQNFAFVGHPPFLGTPHSRSCFAFSPLSWHFDWDPLKLPFFDTHKSEYEVPKISISLKPYWHPPCEEEKTGSMNFSLGDASGCSYVHVFMCSCVHVFMCSCVLCSLLSVLLFSVLLFSVLWRWWEWSVVASLSQWLEMVWMSTTPTF